MMRLFRTDDSIIYEADNISEGVWIELSAPDNDEITQVISSLKLNREDLMAAIDLEEKNRIEIHDNYTLILVDIPAKETRHQQESYTTIPLGIIITENNIGTVCSQETSVLGYFRQNRMKDFSTKKKLRFVYQIMFRASLLYQQALTDIDSKRTEFEENIENITSEQDLISLHELESTLVYFSTSLRGNYNVLNRLERYSRIQRYPEDKELLDDVIIENQQAIEMAQIYRDIIDSTRELMSSMIDSKLNNVMKRLTSITLILSIPTIISGLYGMNVDQNWMPLAYTPHGFGIISILTATICVVLIIYLRKKRML